MLFEFTPKKTFALSFLNFLKFAFIYVLIFIYYVLIINYKYCV